MKLFFSCLLICLNTYVGFSQKRNQFNSIKNIADEREQLTQIINIPFDKATSNIKQYDSIIDYGIVVAQKLQDSIFLANLFEKKALALHFTSKDEKAIDYTLKVIQIYKKKKLPLKLGKALVELGWKLKYRDLPTALSYMLQGIKSLEKENRTNNNLIGAYNNYGVLKNYNKQLDSAIYYHRKSLKLAEELNDSVGIPFAHTHIASVLMKTKKFDLAKKHLDKSLDIRTQRNDIYGITDTELYFGDLFFEKKEFPKAINHFEEAYKLASKKQYYPLKKYASELLHKSYDSIKNYKQSLFYLKVFTKMKDSILNKNTNNKISELTIKYKTAEKEKEIALQKEELLANELAIKNKNLFALLLGATLLIVAILAVGYYHRSQYKRKQLQKEIDLKDALATIKMQNKLQEQRLRISRDLHDNIGSQLSFIISSIDNLKRFSVKKEKIFVEKLSNISSFTSETISQLRDTIWAMNKSEILAEDLHTRLLSFVEKAKTAVPETTIEVNNSLKNTTKFTSIIGMNLFRVTQEAINNAIKYSKASKIEIELKETTKKYSISIIDNGVGFDITKVSLGNGLTNIESRMSQINGKAAIKSNINKGTQIIVSVSK